MVQTALPFNTLQSFSFVNRRGFATQNLQNHTKNEKVIQFVKDKIRLCQPDSVHICDGSDKEFESLCAQMVKSGTLTKLSRPGSHLALSDEKDVARVESSTFVCSKTKDEAGPNNNWVDPNEMMATMNQKFNGVMKGRTMYVIPFSMGPLAGPISHIGVQVTDSPYVAASMKIMTRMGQQALDVLGTNGDFVPCVHTYEHKPMADYLVWVLLWHRDKRTFHGHATTRSVSQGILVFT